MAECNKFAEDNKFLEITSQHGAMTRSIWQLNNRLPIFKNYLKADLSNAEWLEERVVSIPSSVCL